MPEHGARRRFLCERWVRTNRSFRFTRSDERFRADESHGCPGPSIDDGPIAHHQFAARRGWQQSPIAELSKHRRSQSEPVPESARSGAIKKREKGPDTRDMAERAATRNR